MGRGGAAGRPSERVRAASRVEEVWEEGRLGAPGLWGYLRVLAYLELHRRALRRILWEEEVALAREGPRGTRHASAGWGEGAMGRASACLERRHDQRYARPLGWEGAGARRDGG
eukprot:743746-Prymnesium_polylepis.1